MHFVQLWWAQDSAQRLGHTPEVLLIENEQQQSHPVHWKKRDNSFAATTDSDKNGHNKAWQLWEGFWTRLSLRQKKNSCCGQPHMSLFLSKMWRISCCTMHPVNVPMWSVFVFGGALTACALCAPPRKILIWLIRIWRVQTWNVKTWENNSYRFTQTWCIDSCTKVQVNKFRCLIHCTINCDILPLFTFYFLIHFFKFFHVLKSNAKIYKENQTLFFIV